MRKNYIFELNRPHDGRQMKRDDIVRRFKSRGFSIDATTHKTTFVVDGLKKGEQKKLKNALRGVLKLESSSVVLFCRDNGKAWIMKNSGNQAGIFVEI